MMAGQWTSYADLVESEGSFIGKVRADDPCQRSSNATPTLGDVTVQAAKAPRYKAVLEDRIGGDLAKAAPKGMGSLRHPLHTKVAMTLRPPLQWRVGRVWKY